MKELIANFTKQLEEAIKIGEKAQLSDPKHEIKNILISGLGGSGIGGSIAAELLADKATLPITVKKDYFIPAFVNENTLVIISSYSGDTEETLSAMNFALERNAKVVCVTSGGQITQIAKQKNLDLILIPGSMPPRACLAYSFTQLFFILSYFKVIDGSFKSEIKQAIENLNKSEEAIKKEAEDLAGKLKNKIPVIYATVPFDGVAVRFRQQINENSKLLCWSNVFPEMNHNELVGWASKQEQLGVVILRSEAEYYRNKKRVEISKDVFSRYCDSINEVFAKGSGELERALYLIHLCDWTSSFIADQRGVDPVEVKVINHLKSELSKI
jgi:glucose/mannose-6-phosphate isomerase